MIQVEKEDVEELKKIGFGLWKLVELCTFCRTPTRHWHAATNNPVCPNCANWHEEKELKNHFKNK